MQGRLPLELYYKVFNEIDDKPTLASCALLSPLLVNHMQRLIFSHLD